MRSVHTMIIYRKHQSKANDSSNGKHSDTVGDNVNITVSKVTRWTIKFALDLIFLFDTLFKYNW